MRTEIRPTRYIFASILLFALLVSCDKKPDFIGRELLPSGDNFTVSFDSIETVCGYTRYADSIRASYKENYLLGSVSDPFFGYSKAEILTTISSSITSRGFGPNAVADSVILFVSWSERSGDGGTPLHLSLYESNELLRYDSAYYTNMDMTGKYREPELSSVTLPLNDTMLKIFITDQLFIDKFLTAEDSILSNSDYLQEMMYGLYLTTSDAVDEGDIVNINFDDPGNILYFYYSNDTAASLSQYYLLSNSYNGRVNIFRHDPTGYPLEGYLQNGSDNDSILFVQSMAGVSSRIRFPQLERWMDSMPIAINEARLVFTMADTVYTMQHKKNFPESLGLYLVNEDGSISRIYDYLLDATGFGGVYDENTRTYSFTIKVHLQSLLAGDVDNLEMLLTTGNIAESVRRAAIYGWNPKDYRKSIRLEITYTLL
jgi:hypothetical protein